MEEELREVGSKTMCADLFFIVKELMLQNFVCIVLYNSKGGRGLDSTLVEPSGSKPRRRMEGDSPVS